MALTNRKQLKDIVVERIRFDIITRIFQARFILSTPLASKYEIIIITTIILIIVIIVVIIIVIIMIIIRAAHTCCVSSHLRGWSYYVRHDSCLLINYLRFMLFTSVFAYPFITLTCITIFYSTVLCVSFRVCQDSPSVH